MNASDDVYNTARTTGTHTHTQEPFRYNVSLADSFSNSARVYFPLFYFFFFYNMAFINRNFLVFLEPPSIYLFGEELFIFLEPGGSSSSRPTNLWKKYPFLSLVSGIITFRLDGKWRHLLRSGGREASVVLLLIPSCRLPNFGTAGRVCFSPFFFFFLSCVVVVGSSHSTLQKSWPLPQKAMFIDTHPRRGRHTSVSFPIWFVQLLTLAPPFCSPTTTTARRRRKQKTTFQKSKGNHRRNDYWAQTSMPITKRDSVVELF